VTVKHRHLGRQCSETVALPIAVSHVGKGGASRTRGIVVFFDFLKELKTLNFIVSMVI